MWFVSYFIISNSCLDCFNFQIHVNVCVCTNFIVAVGRSLLCTLHRCMYTHRSSARLCSQLCTACSIPFRGERHNVAFRCYPGISSASGTFIVRRMGIGDSNYYSLPVKCEIRNTNPVCHHTGTPRAAAAFRWKCARCRIPTTTTTTPNRNRTKPKPVSSIRLAQLQKSENAIIPFRSIVAFGRVWRIAT